MNTNDAVVLAAIATAVYALLTFLLLLEARSARIASMQTAVVVARLTFSRDNQLDTVVRLENFGPAVAEDVRLRIAFLGADEAVIVERTVWVPAMARGDDEPYLPALLLPAEAQGTDAALATIRDQGSFLELEWTWRDSRRSWRTLLLGRAIHRRALKVRVSDYHESVMRGPRFLEPNLVSVTQAASAATERHRTEQRQRRSLSDMELPPSVQADLDARALVERAKLWWARARALPRHVIRVLREEDR